MKTKPLVSIIMLSYNNVRFVKRAIDSVLAQTYTNFELVISDDCSSDGSWELIQKLAESDRRIRCYQPKSNLGIVKNRLFAYEKTKGKAIGHLDGDDELYPYSLEMMMEHLKPDIALAQSDNAWMDQNSAVYQYHANKDPQPNLAFAGWRHFGVYWRWAYETTNGYNTQLISACEDGDLFMQIAEKHKVIRVPQVLYKHRWHEKNQSFSNKKCAECSERPVCHYIRVWGKHAGVDPITFKPVTHEV